MQLARSPDPSFLNKIAWRLSAGVAAGASLIAVILTSSEEPTVSPPDVAPTMATAARPAPLPAAAGKVPVGGDVNRCIGFCARHVTSDRSFVIFTNGTCVIVDEPSHTPIVDANRSDHRDGARLHRRQHDARIN